MTRLQTGAAAAYLLEPDVQVEDDCLARTAHRWNRVLHVLCCGAGDQLDCVGSRVIPHLQNTEVEDLNGER